MNNYHKYRNEEDYEPDVDMTPENESESDNERDKDQPPKEQFQTDDDRALQDQDHHDRKLDDFGDDKGAENDNIDDSAPGLHQDSRNDEDHLPTYTEDKTSPTNENDASTNKTGSAEDDDSQAQTNKMLPQNHPDFANNADRQTVEALHQKSHLNLNYDNVEHPVGFTAFDRNKSKDNSIQNKGTSSPKSTESDAKVSGFKGSSHHSSHFQGKFSYTCNNFGQPIKS